MTALPALAKALKSVSPPLLLVMTALPAVGASVPNGWPNEVVPPPVLVMFAPDADDWSRNTVPPPLRLVIVAVPALVDAAKIVPALLLSILALPAVAVSVPPLRPNSVTLPPRFLIVALPALLASRNATR